MTQPKAEEFVPGEKAKKYCRHRGALMLVHLVGAINNPYIRHTIIPQKQTGEKVFSPAP